MLFVIIAFNVPCLSFDVRYHFRVTFYHIDFQAGFASQRSLIPSLISSNNK